MFIVFTRTTDFREDQWAVKVEGKEVTARYILGYTYDAIEGEDYFSFEKVDFFSMLDAVGIMEAIAEGHVECTDKL